jgi:hypothetical protein
VKIKGRSGPRSGDHAKRVEIGLGWLLARPPGLPVPCSGTTAGLAAFAASWLLSGLQAQPVDRLGLQLLKALASGAAQGVG